MPEQAKPAAWCETCGNETQGPDQSCVCWCLLADALQQYLGMDHDGSAQMAADLWAGLDPEDKARVWSAEYAADHITGNGEPIRTYPDPRTPEGFAPAWLREEDARDFPHDEPCPRCGRRRWGLGPGTVDASHPTDAEQATCGACGYVYEEEI